MKKLFRIVPLFGAIILLMFSMTACIDADPVVQIDKMESMGYYYYDCQSNGSEVDYGSAESALHFAIHDSTGESVYAQVYIFYYASDYDAIQYVKDFEDYTWRVFQMYNAEAASGYEYTRIGKIFLFGSEDAMEDALSVIVS